MSAPKRSEVEEFAELLAKQPGEWSRAKAEAFARIVEAFPDPAGPPEWALRQIARGQFDRRIPPAWRPVFVEVFHQWLGFRADTEAERESRPSSAAWWLRSLVPGLRRHGWAGALVSPLAALVVAVLFGWSCLLTASSVRSEAIRRTDRALTGADASALSWQENLLAARVRDGGDEALLGALAVGQQVELSRRMATASREGAVAKLDGARRLGGTWWAWPWNDLSAR